MTNLSAPSPRQFRGSLKIKTVVHTLASAVFAGAAVELASGLGQNLTGAGTTFTGIATQSGIAGDRIEIADDCVVQLTVTKATNWAAGDVGSIVYGSDGNTYTLTSTSNQAMGRVEEIESGIGTTSAVVWVRVRGMAQRGPTV